MTDNIKLPPMPEPYTKATYATSENTPSVKAGYEQGGYEKTPPLFDEHQMEAYGREAVRLNAQAQQPLTDEHKAILQECRNQAMKWTVEARIPEAGAFGGIAQDLDYLCAQLGVKND